MPTSPRGADELVEGQAIPETTVNEIVRHTEAGACLFPVVDQDLTAPPGTCGDGASYIIAASPTGLWSGKAKQVATALGTNAANGWRYHTPVEGFFAYVQDENKLFNYDGSDWMEFAGGAGGVQLPADIDPSTAPAYPASTAGQSYRAITAGTVGGRPIEEGDWIICRVDSDAGTQVEVGMNFFVIQGDLTVSNNEEMDSGEAGAPSQTMPVTEAAVVGYIESLDLGPQSIQELLSTLPPNDDPEDPQPINNGSVPIYRDGSPGFWETAFSVEAGHVLGTVADGMDITTNFYHIGVIFDEGLGNVKGNLPFRDTDFWDVLAPPAIDATQYVLSITDGVFSYIAASSVGSTYTNENAQDAVGAMVDSSLVYTDATPLLSRAALTGAITASEGSNTTALGSFTKSQLDTAVSDGNVLYVGDVTASSLGLGTGDSPQFTAVNIGHASDTTITRTGAGDIAVEGNAIYRAGGTDVALVDGGTGSSTMSGAQTNLGFIVLADQAAYDALSPPDSNTFYFIPE